MMHNRGFSPRDWELAPQYVSPVSRPGVVVLDFNKLTSLARTESANGSFQRSSDGTFAAAPLFVDDLPAAFYKVNTSYPQFTPNHNTSERETLVVVAGVLKLVMNDGTRSDEGDKSLENTFYTGQVVELHEEPISMQAIGLIDPASCLALALYRERDKRQLTIL